MRGFHAWECCMDGMDSMDGMDLMDLMDRTAGWECALFGPTLCRIDS